MSDQISHNPPVCIRVTGVRKHFGGIAALRDVSLEVRSGEVHALVGENGAGKSTLMRILSGACQPDAGLIELEGQRFLPENPLHARRCGVAMIYQELNLVPHLTVAENIMLGAEPHRGGWLLRQQRDKMAAAALAELQANDLPLDEPVAKLSLASQQVVEIARALIGDPKVLIMDEPTSSLSSVDTENLFRVIDRLRRRGVAIIYISHFLEECRRICDRYTVLRDGQSVAGGLMADVTLRDLIRLMVGREIQEIYPRGERRLGEPVLELRDLSGQKKPRDLNLLLRRGEILGVAGLIGAGRTETARACFGLDAIKSGSVLIEGVLAAAGRPRDRIDQGIGLLSEDRKGEGLMLAQDVAENLTLTRTGPFAKFGWISSRRRNECAARWMKRLQVRAQSPAQRVGELSGGNQQKVALARLLHQEARILLLDEPTRGVDVGSKAEIYRLMNELAADGRAIVFISSYIPELLGVCDTIAVMCRGKLVDVRPAAAWTEESVIAAAVGQGGITTL